jgi:hypothetical protein
MTAPMPVERPAAAAPVDDARAARIAALHGFADWLAKHPDAPVPTVVWAEHHITEQDEQDEYTRVMGALQILHKLHVAPYEGNFSVQGDLDICTLQMHGIRIIYRVCAIKNTVPDQRYVTRNGS